MPVLQSMTGFGEAQLEEDRHAYHVEIRSVNNRYLKTSIRLPEDFAFLEAPLEQFIRRRLSRGSATLRLEVRDLSASAAQDINLAAIQHYIQQFQAVEAPGITFGLDLATLAMLPGVCQPHELTEHEREHATSVITRLTEQAVDRLIEMRRREGAALVEDLRRHLGGVREHITAVRERVPVVVDEYRQRLTARVQQLVAQSNVTLAADDLLKEVAIYAERSDISEEIARLDSHLRQFGAALEQPEPTGRKLDFIAQEMLREANTIGSKAGDVEIARRIIEIKGAIDRIKEQVQNVE